MQDLTIIITGARGAGITTAISSLSDTPVLSMAVTSNTENLSASPVCMECGEIPLEGGQRIKLYGAPGPDPESGTWELCTENVLGNLLGIVILINNAARQPLEELDFYLQRLSSVAASAAIVIGITHTDESNCPSIDLYHQFMREKKLFHPLFPIDVRRTKDVNVLIEAMMAMLQVA